MYQILKLFGIKRLIFLSRKIDIYYKGEKLSFNFSKYTSLSISISCKTSVNFLITKEQHYTSEKLLPNLPLFIESNGINKVKNFFYNLFSTSKLFGEIFHPFVNALELDGNNLIIEIDISKKDNDYNYIISITEGLIQLKYLLENNFIVKSKELLGKNIKVKFTIFLLSVIPIILSLFFLAYSISLNLKSKNDYLLWDDWKLFIINLFFVSPFLLIYILSSNLISKKYLLPSKKMSIIIFFSILLFFSSMPLVQSLNGYLDNSKPQEKIYTIVDCKKGKGESYYLVLSDVVGKNKTSQPYSIFFYKKLYVKRNECRKAIQANSRVKIYIKKGFFNIKWVYGYSIYQISPN